METFNKCIQTLHYSKSDNERLASLMVISKITPSLDLTKEMIEELYRAVSSNFLCRLLKASINEDENAIMFKLLAVNILSTISKMNAQIVSSDAQLLDCLLENLKDYPVKTSEDDTSTKKARSNRNFFVDFLELLTVLAGDEQGWKYFSQNDIYNLTTRFLATSAEPADEKHEQKTKCLFLQMLKHSSPDMDKHFMKFLCEETQRMKSTQEIDKFKHLDVILILFQILTEVGIFVDVALDIQSKNILKNVLASVHDLLKSRIKDTYKQKTIQLVSYLFQVFGVGWLLDKELTGQATDTFILLLLTSVSVELTFILSLDRQFCEIAEMKEFITGCFSIERSLLTCICGDAFAGDELVADGSFIIKVFNSFKTTMMSVYSFLQHVDMEDRGHPVVIEALIMAGVWATEETESLRDELKSVIPLFMKVAQKCLDDNTETMTGRYFAVLTPCVGQLLPDKTMRNVLKSNHCLQVFQDYSIKLLSQHNKSQNCSNQDTGLDTMNTLECAIHVFHEYVILEYDYCQNVLWPKSLVNRLVTFLMNSLLSELPKISVHSLCELLTLVLRLYQIAPSQGDYKLEILLPKALDFLSTLINDVMEYENSLDEIWHISMQAISETFTSDKILCDVVKRSFDFESKFPSSRYEKETEETIQLMKRTVLL